MRCLMPNLSVVDVTWIFLAVIFFYFTSLFWMYSNRPVRRFVFRSGWGGGDSDEEPDIGDDKAQFLDDLEGFVESTNRRISMRFRIGSVAFAIAGVLSVVAMMLE
jgi:hypothetical protein